MKFLLGKCNFVSLQLTHDVVLVNQKLALQASGANALPLGNLSMMPGMSGALMPGMISGMSNGLSPVSEPATKVVCLTQVQWNVGQLCDLHEFVKLVIGAYPCPTSCIGGIS